MRHVKHLNLIHRVCLNLLFSFFFFFLVSLSCIALLFPFAWAMYWSSTEKDWLQPIIYAGYWASNRITIISLKLVTAGTSHRWHQQTTLLLLEETPERRAANINRYKRNMPRGKRFSQRNRGFGDLHSAICNFSQRNLHFFTAAHRNLQFIATQSRRNHRTQMP